MAMYRATRVMCVIYNIALNNKLSRRDLNENKHEITKKFLVLNYILELLKFVIEK